MTSGGHAASVASFVHAGFHSSSESVTRVQVALQVLLYLLFREAGSCFVWTSVNGVPAGPGEGLSDVVSDLLVGRVAEFFILIGRVKEGVCVEHDLINNQDQGVATEGKELWQREELILLRCRTRLLLLVLDVPGCLLWQDVHQRNRQEDSASE